MPPIEGMAAGTPLANPPIDIQQAADAALAAITTDPTPSPVTTPQDSDGAAVESMAADQAKVEAGAPAAADVPWGEDANRTDLNTQTAAKSGVSRSYYVEEALRLAVGQATPGEDPAKTTVRATAYRDWLNQNDQS